MKSAAIALWSILGVVISSAAAFAVPVSSARPGGEPTVIVAANDGDPSRFSGGSSLILDARLGHKELPPGGGETFVFASVAGRDATDRGLASPVHIGIVIDRSGSMRGARIANALAAAVGTVERMRDGDLVSVVSFDDSSQVVVPPTRLSSSSRAGIEAAIRSIRLGGDTCISCGLETAMSELMRNGAASDGGVTRMLLLSDGAANRGVRDVSGLRSIAASMRDQGCTISTIGVDVDFDEKIMSAIATESNGRHYFVADATQLPSVFQQEFDSLVSTVASDAELEIELAPGVEPVQVFDRSHRRSGQHIIVPFGTLSAHQEKTVLVKVRVPASFTGDAAVPVAKLRLAYRPNSGFGREETDGVLAVRSRVDASLDALDPFVSARLSRSLTADSLTQANQLFEEGHVEEARARLSAHADALAKSEKKAKDEAPSAAAPKTAAKPLADDFDQQIAAVREAERSFGNASQAASAAATGGASAAPAAPADRREGRAQVRTNQANAQALGF